MATTAVAERSATCDAPDDPFAAPSIANSSATTLDDRLSRSAKGASTSHRSESLGTWMLGPDIVDPFNVSGEWQGAGSTTLLTIPLPTSGPAQSDQEQPSDGFCRVVAGSTLNTALRPKGSRSISASQTQSDIRYRAMRVGA